MNIWRQQPQFLDVEDGVNVVVAMESLSAIAELDADQLIKFSRVLGQWDRSAIVNTHHVVQNELLGAKSERYRARKRDSKLFVGTVEEVSQKEPTKHLESAPSFAEEPSAIAGPLNGVTGEEWVRPPPVDGKAAEVAAQRSSPRSVISATPRGVEDELKAVKAELAASRAANEALRAGLVSTPHTARVHLMRACGADAPRLPRPEEPCPEDEL